MSGDLGLQRFVCTKHITPCGAEYAKYVMVRVRMLGKEGASFGKNRIENLIEQLKES